MALITLEEAKEYLRVETADEDAMIGILLSAACKLCADVARFTDEQWAIVDSDAKDSDEYSAEELNHIRKIMKPAILYAVAHMYEYRDQADYHNLVLTLRSILFSIREGVV